MYVKIVFLNKNLKVKVKTTISEGFDNAKLAKKVWRLVKVLYCFKQAPRTWYIDDHF